MNAAIKFGAEYVAPLNIAKTTAISAIIVNYNAGSLLRDCVDSLVACPLNIEIIVVDNASLDGSLDHLSESPTIRMIRNPVNIGFAAACNIGIHASSAPFLLFLNPDCFFQPSVVATLLAGLKSDDRVGMVGGLLVNADGSEQGGGRRAVPTPWRSFVRACGLHRFADRWPKLFYDFHLHKQPLPEVPIEVEAISGACMLVKREAIEDVGPWDEGYFLHCEDLDWCMRFRQRDWKILFVPDAPIYHALGACSRSRRIFVEWHKHKGMVRFYDKFFRHQYPGALMWMVTLGVWLRFGLAAAYLTARRLLAGLGLIRG
jgi:GT2 family glycosyltransferase